MTIVLLLVASAMVWAGGSKEQQTAPAVKQTAPATAAPSTDSATSGLPDLKGQAIVAVTGNDYVPLNFVNPKTGKAEGWEYDAVNEIARRLNAKVTWKVTSWDTMIAAIHNGQFDVGMTVLPLQKSGQKKWISLSPTWYPSSSCSSEKTIIASPPPQSFERTQNS
jgi:ABC-type amino acid transport substrate-binding protein